jgi:hypothetical protein
MADCKPYLNVQQLREQRTFAARRFDTGLSDQIQNLAVRLNTHMPRNNLAHQDLRKF